VLHGALHDPVQMADELYARVFEWDTGYSI
jgi:bifunctional enzyme CysN/CysC